MATGTGMAGYDSTVPAPIPANPRPRQSPLGYRGENAPHPRQRRVPGTRRGLHGDLQANMREGGWLEPRGTEGRRRPRACGVSRAPSDAARLSPQGCQDEETRSRGAGSGDGKGRPEHGWCAARRRCMQPSRPTRVRSCSLLSPTRFGGKVEGGCE
jgi:hypothetical protein